MRTPSLAASAIVALLAIGRLALADESRCALGIRMTDPDIGWQRAIDGLRAELAQRTDVETCLAIDLVRGELGVRITAMLPNGRAAVRHVHAPGDLRAAVIALVLIPIAPPPAIARETASAYEAPAPSAAPGAREAVTLERGHHFDIGAAVGTTWVAQARGRSFNARLALGRAVWSVELAGRWHGFTGLLSSNSSTEVTMHMYELGAALGTRLVAAERFGLTLALGPSIAGVREYMGFQGTPAAPPVRREGLVARFSGNLRAAIPITDRFRMFVGVDLGFVASRSDDFAEDMADEGPPTWSGELSIGGELRAWP